MIEERPVLSSSMATGEYAGLPKDRPGGAVLQILAKEIHRIGEQSLAMAALIALTGMFLIGYCLANPFLFQRIVKIEGLASKGFFVIVHGVAILALLAAVWSSKKVFYSVVTVSFLSILLDNCFFLIKHYPITLSDLAVLLASHGNIGDAVTQFSADFGRALATAALVALCLLLMRSIARPQRYASGLVMTLMTVSFLFYLIIAIFKGEPSLVALPASNTLLFGGSVITLDNEIHSFEAAPPSSAKKSDFPVVADADSPKHIILIIDESVEAKAFQDLYKQAFENATDMGVAFSGANCSAASNYILRVGPDDLGLSKTLRVTPTLFQLAKGSDFTTEYYDLQGVLQDTAVHDYFSSEELAAVDHVHRTAEFGARNFEHDMSFANRFSQLVGQGDKNGKVFAIVNKTGSHFPYASNLPPELAGSKDAYGASVTLSTIHFLHEIDATLPESTVVFYTSDHGQNFAAKSPHCNGASDSTLGEWRVPLLVFTSKDLNAFRGKLNSAWANRASHFELTETIRVLLGYQAMFAKTLFDPATEASTKPYRAYFGPIKGLLGRPASYREFSRESLGSTSGLLSEKRAAQNYSN